MSIQIMNVVCLATVVLAGVVSASTARADELDLRLKQTDNALVITYLGQPLAKYVFRDTQIPRPYFCDVHAVNGVRITRHHPPREGIDLTDHELLHPGVWLAFGDLGGVDFWRNKATVRHVGFAGTPRVYPGAVMFTAINRYENQGRALCEERCAITIQVVEGAWHLDWRSTFFALVDGIYFGDQEEMGLGVRLATDLTVQKGGTIINGQGLVNEKQAWGKPSAACSYFGTSDGKFAGVTMTPNPDNFRPCWFHVRDYGLLAGNPFGRSAFTQGPASRVDLQREKPLTLAYRLTFHSQLPTGAPMPHAADLGSLDPTAPPLPRETALDRYIAQPDPEYGFQLVSSTINDGLTTSVLELTSQSWRTDNDVDRPVWKHWLTIAQPEKPSGSSGFLFIGAGSNHDPAPTAASPRVVALARETNTVVAEVKMVPNQPLHFADSPEVARVEDDIIGYSRVKFMETKDETWLVRLAMVKSGVRALDAFQQFCASEQGGGLTLTDFVVAGGSKRGWTTWLVGLVDPRVKAIVPLVIDALNSEEITRHHYQAYGFFSSALDDYVRHKIFPQRIGTPEYQAALAIEDPYQHRQRPSLRMPKFMINAAGDEFFLPDNAQFYFRELPEEKHIRYVPNAKHSLAGSDATESLQAFYQAVLTNRPRPRMRWEKNSDGSLRVVAHDRPQAATLWQATNPKARDFRLDVLGPAYTSTPLNETEPGVFVGRVDKPATGFTAFFVELTYESGGKHPFKFTTEVSVVPDVLPFDFDEFQSQARAQP